MKENSHTIGAQRVLEKNDEKTKEVKLKYERQLTELRTELRSLKSARKEHAKAMKKNVCVCVFCCICQVCSLLYVGPA